MDTWEGCMQELAADKAIHALDPCRLLHSSSWQPALQPVLRQCTWQVALPGGIGHPCSACRPLYQPPAARSGFDPCAGQQLAACGSHPQRDAMQPAAAGCQTQPQGLTGCAPAQQQQSGSIFWQAKESWEQMAMSHQQWLLGRTQAFNTSSTTFVPVEVPPACVSPAECCSS